MPHALFSLLWTGNVFFLITVLSGLHFWGNEKFLQSHIASALTAVFLLLFAHSMIMFYFIGTGKKIKEVIAPWENEKEKFWNEVLFVKRKLFPPMTWVCLLLIGAFLSGGALSANLVGKQFHQYAIYSIFIYNIYVSILESKYIVKNLALMTEVGKLQQQKLQNQK